MIDGLPAVVPDGIAVVVIVNVCVEPTAFTPLGVIDTIRIHEPLGRRTAAARAAIARGGAGHGRGQRIVARAPVNVQLADAFAVNVAALLLLTVSVQERVLPVPVSALQVLVVV